MLRVVKIGGSLLSLEDLAERLAQWQRAQTPATTLFIVGGGGVIEAMRELDSRFQLDTVAMHWRCVALLRATFEVAAEIFPDWETITNPAQLARAGTPSNANKLVRVDTFYAPDQAAAGALPASWETTTDSIAALLARQTQAAELHLLKSCKVPENANVSQLAAAGIVDAHFPVIADGSFSVAVHNLREIPTNHR